MTERIRGPDLAVLVKRSNGVPFEEGLRKANEGNLVIVSNARLSKALVGSEEWRKVKEAFACWSGTMTAYVEPNTPLNEKTLLVINELEKLAGTRYFIGYTDPQTNKHWLFPVHPDYFGKQNAILVSEHPNYTLQTDGNRIITLPASMSLKEAVDLVENFPGKNGWYKGDPKHDIPIISQSDPDRHLSRIDKRVGPAARGCIIFIGGGRQFVDLDGRPSVGLGVVVEAAAGGTPLETPVPGSPIQLKLTRESPDTLIVKGTSEQVDAAVRLLGQLNTR